MGGLEDGEVAARAVIDAAGRLWATQQELPADPQAFLATLAAAAHEAVRAAAPGAGATLAALLAGRQRAWWIHIGDSRVYGFRDGLAVCRSEDHTVVQQLVRSGAIEPEQAATHPEQHKLLRCLGGELPAQPTHGQMATGPGAAFVLCTDGFWAAVRDAEMAALLAAGDLQQACEAWVDTAVARNGVGGDNASLAALRLPAAAEGREVHRRLWPLYAAATLTTAVLLWLALR